MCDVAVVDFPLLSTREFCSFIRELRETCLEQKPGNKAFWDAVRAVGRPLSLISKSEASKAGGKSTISESEAQKVSVALFCVLHIAC